MNQQIKNAAIEARDLSVKTAKSCKVYMETKVNCNNALTCEHYFSQILKKCQTRLFFNNRSYFWKLIQNRIFKGVALGLLAYITYCKLWNFYYDQILKQPRPKSTIQKITIFGYQISTLTSWFLNQSRVFMGGVIHEVLADEQINVDGLNFLDRAFRHPLTQDAGVSLLSNVIQDKRFIENSKVFSTDLIVHVIT